MSWPVNFDNQSMLEAHKIKDISAQRNLSVTPKPPLISGLRRVNRRVPVRMKSGISSFNSLLFGRSLRLAVFKPKNGRKRSYAGGRRPDLVG